MAQSFHCLLAAATLLSLVSCQKESATTPSAALEGTWRLTSRQYYCTPTPVPNEPVALTATKLAFYRGNRAVQHGDYTLGTAAVPCFSNGTTVTALHLTYSTSSASPGLSGIQYRLAGNTLTLDYGGPCDAPVDMYVRLR